MTIDYCLIQKQFLNKQNIVRFIKHITTDFGMLNEAYEHMMYSEYFNGKFDICDAKYIEMIENIQFEPYLWSIQLNIVQIDTSVDIIQSIDDIKVLQDIFGTSLVQIKEDKLTLTQHIKGNNSRLLDTMGTSVFIWIAPMINDENYVSVLRKMKDMILCTKMKNPLLDCVFYLLVNHISCNGASEDEIIGIMTYDKTFDIILANHLFYIDKKFLSPLEIEYYKVLEKLQEYEINHHKS